MKRGTCRISLSVRGAMNPGTAFAVERTKPESLFIKADELGKDWIGCCGADEIETPRIVSLKRGR